MRTRSLIETFEVANEHGETRDVSVYQNWICTRFGERPGRKEAFDEHGDPLNWVAEGIFEHFATGELLVRL